jgi:ribosomal protein L40E
VTTHETAQVRADKPADLLDNLINAAPVCDSSPGDLFIGSTDEPDEAQQCREAHAKSICLGCPARAPPAWPTPELPPRPGS